MANVINKKQFTTYILLLLAIILVLNIVSKNLFTRLDVTDNSMYSLSESSKNIIEKLDDRLIAKVFFSEDLPGKAANSRRFLQDMLEEYSAYSGGSFNFEFINPDDDKDYQKEAMNFGIPPVQIQVVENDKLEIKNVYMGLVLLYNDKKEVLPVIETTDGLEYTITTAIKKITSTGMNKIGFVTRNTDPKAHQKMREILSETYNISNVDLNNDIPVDINTLLINGFTDSLSENELYNLDQFIMKGGNIMLSQGKLDAKLQQGYAEEVNSNIFELLENYGIEINKDMIIDQDCGQIQMSQSQGIFRRVNSVEYPPFPVIHKFNKENIIVKNLESARLFFANEVTPRDTIKNFTPLLLTSDKTGTLQGPRYNIYPMNNPGMKFFSSSSKTVGALISGQFSSFFNKIESELITDKFLPRSSNSNILIIGSTDFFNDAAAGGVPENIEFILNSIDYLSGDSELIDIRSRGITARPLEKVSDGGKKIWKWVNILLPALLVILFGLFRWKTNRSKRNFLEELYG
ncbi:MAG: Gldg family protein [Candidatus Delongbacteria bacterium]|nr:Gldg family protein [Candidatus Delongbacteria bacterium]